MSLGPRDPPGSASLGLELITGGHLHAQNFFLRILGSKLRFSYLLSKHFLCLVLIDKKCFSWLLNSS